MLFLRSLRPLLTPLLLDCAFLTSITGIALFVERLGFTAEVVLPDSSESTLRIASARWSSKGMELVRDRGNWDILDHGSAMDDGPPRSESVMETADASALCLRISFSSSVKSRCQGFLIISCSSEQSGGSIAYGGHGYSTTSSSSLTDWMGQDENSLKPVI